MRREAGRGEGVAVSLNGDWGRLSKGNGWEIPLCLPGCREVGDGMVTVDEYEEAC